VLTVYLDQNMWVALAQAERGHPSGATSVGALAVFKQAVDEGRVRFPLGTTHYFETGKQRDRRRRMELAATMVRLAGTVRIAPPQTVVPWELRRALVEVLGLTTTTPDIALFGSGVSHAFGSDRLTFTAPTEWEGLTLPPEVLPELQRRGEAAWEALLLASVAATDGHEAVRVAINQFERATDARFVRGQQEVAAAVKEHGRHQLDRIMLATAYTDIREPLARATIDLGITITGLGKKFPAILEATPSRWVEMKLRHQRQANPQKSWHGNDLNDIVALSVAVPYCDVVVTERSWSSMLAAAKVPERFGTTVTRRLQDVADRLS
jgi:hypothetical protein